MSDTEVTCEVFKTTRGGLKLYLDGFTYTRNKTADNVVYWMCEMYSNKVYKCNSTINTSVNSEGQHTIIKQPRSHNHGPDPLRKEIAEIREKIKENSSTGLKVCNIVQNIKAETKPEVLEHLPSTSCLKQIVYRQKSKAKKCVEEPTDIFFELNVSETEMNGANFVIKDRNYDTNKRMLLMSTLELVKTLSKSDYWILDGTFKIAPLIFQQLYTIHGNVFLDNKKTFPLLFCLCTHKDKRSYDLMFELLIEYGIENNINILPKVCILDFEKAAILSLRSNFESAIVHGCHFHFAQIIYRRIQENKLVKKYAKNLKFNLDMKCLVALSYLEHSEIPLYFQKFLENLNDEDSKTIAIWFQENYVFGTANRPAKYLPEFWSCHALNAMNIPRTQNAAEGWHHKINSLVGKPNPKTYMLIKELMKEAKTNLADIEKIHCGSPPENKKRKYIDKDDRISRIIQHKQEYTEMQLLQAIAKNVKL